jgi:hypothetical protein
MKRIYGTIWNIQSVIYEWQMVLYFMTERLLYFKNEQVVIYLWGYWQWRTNFDLPDAEITKVKITIKLMKEGMWILCIKFKGLSQR